MQGTAFDLRKPVQLGKHLQEFRLGGFDHNFCLKNSKEKHFCARSGPFHFLPLREEETPILWGAFCLTILVAFTTWQRTKYHIPHLFKAPMNLVEFILPGLPSSLYPLLGWHLISPLLCLFFKAHFLLEALMLPDWSPHCLPWPSRALCTLSSVTHVLPTPVYTWRLPFSHSSYHLSLQSAKMSVCMLFPSHWIPSSLYHFTGNNQYKFVESMNFKEIRENDSNSIIQTGRTIQIFSTSKPQHQGPLCSICLNHLLPGYVSPHCPHPKNPLPSPCWFKSCPPFPQTCFPEPLVR